MGFGESESGEPLQFLPYLIRRTVNDPVGGHAFIELLSELIRNENGGLRLTYPKTTSSERTLPIPGGLVVMLATYVAENGIGEAGLVFTADMERKGDEGKARAIQRTTTYKRALYRARDKVGVGGFGFHGFRHTAITYLRALGVDEFVAESITGHARKTVHQGYGTAVEAMRIDALAALWDYLGFTVVGGYSRRCSLI